MKNTTALRIAAVLGILSVALGAFGAHSLKNLLQENQTAGVWEKAVFYQFVHTVMLFILGSRKPIPRLSWWAFFFGIILFSGSLYMLAITNRRWLGAITPFGGISFIVGWVCLAIRPKKGEET